MTSDAEVNAAVQRALRELSLNRRDLSDEDLMGLVRPEPKLEQHRKFSTGLEVWMYSIKGWLRGELIAGCTFRSSCLLIMAPNSRQASEWANEGLRDTQEALRTYHLSTPDPRPMAATEVVAGGRKTDPFSTPLIERNPRLFEHIAQRFNRTRH